ncbi:uracil-DNA glycosylase [Thalassotalea sp. LPB0316]|uniref:uracil-DNA glycosylase n=1 Tax=Thalassotalea sp. LPB0316 TaxID=2769490 RepID=UPI0018674072|nr:uracil-DNA glycosylase [Thalassotalea sp. LPB0316]QOL26680.1 uracil-DNA glycosylase [Thalassotalea sp. LPB0316]
MNNWQSFIDNEKQQPYLADTLTYIAHRRAQGVKIYPSDSDLFNAFNLTPYQAVKVVIIGQDPYHGEGQAHGLSFSVQKDVKIPPSLVNMYKELATDIEGFEIPEHGDLTDWAKQGVLLLNTVLSVEQGQAHSHKDLGWETFTDKVVEQLNDREQPMIFILWGAHAKKKGKKINREKHVVIEGPHPSPLSAYRGFFGCRHFSKANQCLVDLGLTPIDWQV